MMDEDPRSNGGMSLQGIQQEAQEILPGEDSGEVSCGVGRDLVPSIGKCQSSIPNDDKIGWQGGKSCQEVVGWDLPDRHSDQPLCQGWSTDDVQPHLDIFDEQFCFIEVVDSSIKL